ncbi:MAG: helix-turn-helix domain-containing protein [Desulfuromonadaceae bacterium]
MTIKCQSKNNSETTIGQRINKIRKSIKLTQAQLAEKLQLTQGFIGHIEKGRNHPSLEQINNIAIILGCNMLWLATGKGDIYPHSTGLTPDLDPDLSKGALLVIDEQQREMVSLMASAPGRGAELLALVKGYLAGGNTGKNGQNDNGKVE